MANVKAVNLEMVNRFNKWLAAQKYSPSTQERYCRVARNLCNYIGNRSLRFVKPMNIGDFLTSTLPSRWADNYIADQLGALRSFFDFLYLGRVVDSVAPRFLKSRAKQRKLPRVLTKAEVAKLLRAATHIRDRALVEMLYSTGCRIGEMRTLRVESIDFKLRCFLVRSKRKDRIVYFGKRASKALRLYLDGRKDGYVFLDKIASQKGYITHVKKGLWLGVWKEYRPNERSGIKHTRSLGKYTETSFTTAQRRFRRFLKGVSLKRYKRDRPLNRSTLGTVIREMGRRAGLGKVNPHSLRHSFATHLLQGGADIRAVQELLGHTFLTSTQIYTRISNQAVRRAFLRFHPRG